MHELIAQITLQITMVWKRRWMAIVVAWFVCSAGWAVVPFIPDTYESSARIFVNTESLLQPLLKGLAVETDPAIEMEMMQRTLLSRPNLEKVTRMTDLDLTAERPEDKENLLTRLGETVTVRAETKNLFQISYENSDPTTARNVVQALLTIYVESNLGSSRSEMDSARRFIDDQIRDYEQKLDDAEKMLVAFKQKNMGLLPGDEGYYQRLQTARTKLETAKGELQGAIAMGTELRKQLKAVPRYYNSTDSSESSGPPSDKSARIVDLEKKIDDMLLLYTAKHPDVKTTMRQLERLRKEVKEGAAEGGPGGPNGNGSGAERTSNPVYEQIKVQVVNSASSVATLKAGVTRAEKAVANLDKLANRVPAVEAELSKLTRDYSVIKKNYEELLSRRESAKISDERESKGEKILFRIVEPPTVPSIPSGPPRLIYLSIIAVVGIGAGIGFAALLANMNQFYFSAASLKQAFAVPVLGSVSMTWSAAQKSWQRVGLASFTFALVGLLGLFAGLLYTESSVGLRNALPPDVMQTLTKRVDRLVTDNLR